MNLVFSHIRALPEPLFVVFAECGADPQKYISCYQFTITTELITDIREDLFNRESCANPQPSAASPLSLSCHPAEPRAAIAATARRLPSSPAARSSPGAPHDTGPSIRVYTFPMAFVFLYLWDGCLWVKLCQQGQMVSLTRTHHDIDASSKPTKCHYVSPLPATRSLKQGA